MEDIFSKCKSICACQMVSGSAIGQQYICSMALTPPPTYFAHTQVTAAFRFIFNEMLKYCKFSNKRLPYRLTDTLNYWIEKHLMNFGKSYQIPKNDTFVRFSWQMKEWGGKLWSVSVWFFQKYWKSNLMMMISIRFMKKMMMVVMVVMSSLWCVTTSPYITNLPPVQSLYHLLCHRPEQSH